MNNNSTNIFRKGQKWISNAEPELGIGRITSADDRLVGLFFELAGEERTYAIRQAPLTRVVFQRGDTIRALDGVQMKVDGVSDQNGILVYTGSFEGTSTAIIETDLDPNITFSKPEERLFTNQIDDNRWFNLRYDTLVRRADLEASTVRGLLGPRVSLIPHQFYISNEVANRHAPRVLLADEVGLGKTIEAGLIMHQQLVKGRASRILVIVPPTLTFQWFVEMIRRFNLQFTILDEERCRQIEEDNRPFSLDDADQNQTSLVDTDTTSDLDNPFEAQQLVLCSLDLFLNNPARVTEAANANWDLVVVDEAHHLHWQEGRPGEDYLAVESIAESAGGLLLLTATPEQLGRLGHFSRLRLLDSTRYHDFNQFLREETSYEDIATLIMSLESDSKAVAEARQRLGKHAPTKNDELMDALLDLHGTGRVLFRNVRDSVDGFMGRQLFTYELDSDRFPADNASAWSSSDCRLSWLEKLILELDDKCLVICSRADTAIALDRHLKDRTTLRSAAFHEHMDLIARDRAANYFADTDHGADVLVCSEIGSEGRNFQFAHHLVMFDLPDNPDLLEQRIGRLDRIGQVHSVSIHVPFAPGTQQHKLLRLYGEGFDIFTKPNATAQVIHDNLPTELDTDEKVAQARRLSTEKLTELKQGRDRLLELNSHKPTVSEPLIVNVEKEETRNLETYMEHSFDAFGLESEPLADNIWHVKPTEAMVRHGAVSAETQDRFRYPELPEEGIRYTFDRETALAREDLHFFTWENPLVGQAMDLAASDVTGNNAVVVVKLAGVKPGTVLTETMHIIECVAPAHLDVGRYLPPSIVRSLLTPNGQDIAETVPFSHWDNALEVAGDALSQIVKSQEQEIRKLLVQAEGIARQKFEPMRQRSLQSMQEALAAEIARLSSLAQVNPNVRQDEIDFLDASRDSLAGYINNAQIRLDAVRLIITT